MCIIHIIKLYTKFTNCDIIHIVLHFKIKLIFICCIMWIFTVLENYRKEILDFPQFDEKHFLGVLCEIESLCQDIRQYLKTRNIEYQLSAFVNHNSVNYYRRILLTYSRQRLMDLKKYRWKFGYILPQGLKF